MAISPPWPGIQLDTGTTQRRTEKVTTPTFKKPTEKIHMTSTTYIGDCRVLDPCCGSRMFWFDSHNPDVVYGDKRTEKHTLCDGRSLEISPDIEMDFRALPFSDGQFKVVVFDPPHLINAGPKSWMAHKYGKLTTDWRDDLRQGFAECFRVLDADGVLIFKWAEVQIKTAEILAFAPYRPLFGHISGKQANTHWITFMKPALFA